VKIKFYLLILFFFLPLSAWPWGGHYLITTYATEKVTWLNQFHEIRVTPFQDFLSKAFSKDFTQKDFLNQYQLNSTYKIDYKHPLNGTIDARSILIAHTDEPDWGMDQNMDISPDQKFMGGTIGPTSQAFRHLYWKTWSLKAPWRTFHIPPREMGQALRRAQIFYDLAQTAFEAKQPYWAFRFLAWSLHYIQDLGQPFHSSQLLTPKFIDWNSIFNFNQLIKRTTQIISNYHFLYEDYVVYKLEEEAKHPSDTPFISILKKDTFTYSSSAYLIARHSADTSNRLSYSIGEACFTFFGKRFLESAIDVPHSPKGTFPMKPFDETKELSSAKKHLFIQNTAQSLEKTGFYTRSLLELAKEEFLSTDLKNLEK